MKHAKLNNLKLRYAEKADIASTLTWANNPQVRAFAYNQNKISHEVHTDWFYSKLESIDCEYYILEVQDKPAGSIRFDIEKNGSAKINYLIDPNYTGKGLGTYILDNGIKFLHKNRPSIKKVYGYVLKENIASIKIFNKLSYNKVSDNGSELKYEKPIK
ncbi:Protein N-acetyltransferase, RimJ/RimL family [Salegentibacter echinorum]|uniref:Protein N-acetyltransferase, RimJ/RimL family n=1 Tax=Salegentibacter echinorum TaxID=1073325 RepID=A0A1M5FG26_SALEC|nr:GNAT family N-acetyltransferase [Salegentibacter echinorum]SHF90379.1 Protein N-acetyltransferase, RimJ/RimL family [Salegentibacter echinorum]